MTRCPSAPDRASVPAAERDAHDGAVELIVRLHEQYGDFSSDHVPGFWGALLNSTPIARVFSEASQFWRTSEASGALPNRVREWVDMVVGQELHSNGIYLGHMGDAVAAGVRPAAIKALREGRDDLLTPEELELANYIRLVIKRSVTDAAFESIEQRLGLRGAVEFTTFVGWLIMVAHIIPAFVGAEPTDGQVDAAVDRYLGRNSPMN